MDARRLRIMLAAPLALLALLVVACRGADPPAPRGDHDRERAGEGRDAASPPALPADRPADFTLSLQYGAGSGMERPFRVRIAGDLLETWALVSEAPVPFTITAADLDAIYAAARAVPPANGRLPPARHSDRDFLHVEVAAASARIWIDSDQVEPVVEDYRLLQQLKTIVAIATAAPATFPERRPAAAAIEIGFAGPGPGDTEVVSITGSEGLVWRRRGDDTSAPRLTPTPAQLDALYAEARAVAAAGLPPGATGDDAVSLRLATPGRRFEASASLSALEPRLRARLEALRDRADALSRDAAPR
ncbi:MAG: hypothetical protein H6708_17650 [Kofleriaceae bacterium]|nr:hypothetical protein [Kofleriaceae bacterium]